MSDLGKYHPNIPKPIQKRVNPSSLRVDRDEAEEMTTLFIIATLLLVVNVGTSQMLTTSLPNGLDTFHQEKKYLLVTFWKRNERQLCTLLS